MPSVAEEHPRVSSAGKKRRRDNDVDSLQGAIYEQAQHHIQQQYAFADFGKLLQHHDAALPLDAYDSLARKIMPIKRQRFLEAEDDNATYNPDGHHRARKHSRSPSGAAASRPPPAHRLTSSAALAPCHVCHRRPTKKSDLDSFAECHGCKARTCFVCLRSCKGWMPEAQQGERSSDAESRDYEEALSRSFHMGDADDAADGHRVDLGQAETQGEQSAVGSRPAGDGWSSMRHQQVVCSKCCIERGQEGDVVCLGCLSQM
ncbi:hypothetical protein VD0002_g8534 [Verticillium dahliae]|uniref:Uncharacterized protein n=2 Tax=Verticillium dahliae TaxID=27337 RepID=G2X2C6_VERDV|nr:uncharacterized protein VDAG_04450 [Verticillium dahliae VdLs.17]KAF3346172.1 Tyrosine-protein phosphatase CDC14 [Verticillium dahliae VDG2]KAH6700199.1 hypothetical protein EV126DRAFT_29779 [Verticillium dahliae]EGY23012.1 hypothetical protein VDAG_04450 [Verticillium dahliae VdLs.17]PNH32031.1 hypothetical protein BJF96_g4744 [Verticillium dahliae]PNH41093.1 hypothetical protein VD0004_g5994 [Verticillium dahliae]